MTATHNEPGHFAELAPNAGWLWSLVIRVRKLNESGSIYRHFTGQTDLKVDSFSFLTLTTKRFRTCSYLDILVNRVLLSDSLIVVCMAGCMETFKEQIVFFKASLAYITQFFINLYNLCHKVLKLNDIPRLRYSWAKQKYHMYSFSSFPIIWTKTLFHSQTIIWPSLAFHSIIRTNYLSSPLQGWWNRDSTVPGTGGYQTVWTPGTLQPTHTKGHVLTITKMFTFVRLFSTSLGKTSCKVVFSCRDTCLRDWLTLFNQWEGALLFTKTSTKCSKNFSQWRTEADRASLFCFPLNIG